MLARLVERALQGYTLPMSTMSRLLAAPALLAAGVMLSAPVEAASLPLPGKTAVKVLGDMSAANHRHYYRYRRGPSAGDVLAGILIVGGIAAVADAATRSNRDERYRDRGYPPPPMNRGGYGYEDGRGIDRAVDMCIAAVEREGRVRSVDYAERTARGWQIRGALVSGDAFNCSLGADGRIENIDVGGRPQLYGDSDRGGMDTPEPYRGSARDDDRYEAGVRYEGQDGSYAGGSDTVEDRQYDDERYAEEWAKHDAEAGAPLPPPAADDDQSQPAYPGGPVPGEDPDDAPAFPGDTI